ncbi:hypothetical protein [Psychrobacter phenylpyruvicus]|uniref:Uncharacterized protein n=1 Tax=Psychrobacter phenylpyruvicus TaxID=29432 RepID=A0A379LPQ2_9GAMM|nr:hypothetical protein [Psychrobacter phenylpyruvicus]SUD91782.1 Uncharacterised protein [Psychrobacter phenylpyruvicus]
MIEYIRNKNSFSQSNLTAMSGRKSLSVIALGAVLGLAGCQPKSDDSTADSNPTVSQQEKAKVVMSESAKAQIARFEEEYVNRKLNLQQSQLAEYEALQAADSPEDNKALFAAAESADNSTTQKKTVGQKLIDPKRDPQSTEAAQSTTAQNTVGSEVTDAAVASSEGADRSKSDTANSTASTTSTQSEAKATDDAAQAKAVQQGESDVEVGQLTLQDLPLINLALVPPQELSAAEIKQRYNAAMQALYLDDAEPLPAQDIDTLLSIAMLTPEIFNNAELAQRLVIKSPSLARLLKQYQTWEQIERQQSAELEALKQSQSAEFEALTAEFNEKIEAYDEQIKNYEAKLKQFK